MLYSRNFFCTLCRTAARLRSITLYASSRVVVALMGMVLSSLVIIVDYISRLVKHLIQSVALRNFDGSDVRNARFIL